MIRVRRFNQLPATTILLLILLATLPVFRVSSNTDTAANRADMTADTVAIVPSPLLESRPVAATNIVQPPASAAPAATVQRPVAQLIPPPNGLQSVSFTLAEGEAVRPQSGGASLLANGEYAINDRVVVVSTFRADSSSVSAPLGTQLVDLADGTSAWATTSLRGKVPNQVAMMRDGLIVTLSGDLPIDDLTALASHIVVRW